MPKRKPKCATCRDDGIYFRLPNGANPFAASITVTARNMRKLICTCEAGLVYRRAISEHSLAK